MSVNVMDLVELKRDGKAYEMAAGQLKTTNIALLFGVSDFLCMWSIIRISMQM